MFRKYKSLTIVSLVSLLMLWVAFLMFEENLVVLFLFCLGALLLGLAFDKNLVLMRTFIMGALLVGGVFYFLSNPPVSFQYTSHVEARTIFAGVEAISMGRSPYVEYNVMPPPLFEFCMLLGSSSVDEFIRNLTFLNYAGILVCALVILGTILLYWSKRDLDVVAKIEFSLGAMLLFSAFFRPFHSNVHLGNVSIPVAVIVMGIIAAYHFNAAIIEGVLIGMAASVKPYFVSLAIGYFFYFIMKRDKKAFRVLMGFSATLIIPMLIFQIVKGGINFDVYREFLRANSGGAVLFMLTLLDNISCAKNMISLVHGSLNPKNLFLISQILSIFAFSIGFYLCWKNKNKEMSGEEMTYYIFITIVITPLCWIHYFSWLFGPILFVYYRSFLTRKINYLIPAIILCCFCFGAFNSIAWISAIVFSMIVVSEIIVYPRCLAGFAGEAHSSRATEPTRS